MERNPENSITFGSYLLGFLICLVLTLASYFLVVEHVLTGIHLFIGLSILMLAQAIVQLFFFLHIAMEPKPRWHLSTFLFMVMIVIILAGGSLWIMYHLNYNVMPR